MRAAVLVFLAAALLLTAASPAPAAERVKLATTTSTVDTGLLDTLLPPFEKQCGLRVDVISVGTGKALALARNGDVDVILVHAREDEDRFVADGGGINRRDVMVNDFVLLGPAKDPAGVIGKKDAVEAFAAVARAGVPFVSRGDDSGTHKKEKELWKAAGVSPSGAWYMESGQGMGATLMMADEKGAYCLADRATATAFEKKVSLKTLCQGDRRLLNPYGIIAVSPAKHPGVNYRGAMGLIAWVTSPEGQKMIGEFKKGGVVLFHPSAYGEAR
jgi:tungstate transport system substrate-binding protein